MLNLIGFNGIVAWEQSDINTRNSIISLVYDTIYHNLKEQNSAFEFFQIESSILLLPDLVNKDYAGGVYETKDALVLRPETTMGSFMYAMHILNPHNKRKVRLPIVVWQWGKSFRKEQYRPIGEMKLKEFNQLEFQIIFPLTTKNDYSILLIPEIAKQLSKFVGEIKIEPSDRLPYYSEETTDIIASSKNLEIASISKRKDFEGAKVLEIAIGLDRCIFLNNLGT